MARQTASLKGALPQCVDHGVSREEAAPEPLRAGEGSTFFVGAGSGPLFLIIWTLL
jgi:hypothetical protein